MNVFTRIAAGALLSVGFAAGAVAQPTIVGTGTDTTIVAPSANGPVWGGALTRQVGSGESAQIEVLTAPQGQPGRTARVVGSGESAQVIYDEPAAAQRFAQTGFRG
jgi:streptogramin lyase